jgi:diguanylate cyclase (GGDEF)-like protein
LALHDEKTGLLNERGLKEALKERWVGREGKLFLALIDLDKFKDINDKHGHKGGDAVLVAVAQKLKTRLHRSTDKVARVGGEEIAIVIDAKDVPAVFTEYYSGLKPGQHAHFRLSVEHEGKKIWVTASGGSVEFDPSEFADIEEAYDDAFRRADELLYLAKQTGRDKIIRDRAAIQMTELNE